ncbi:MAG TPA: GNAT family N-acetyltransferase [Candidatus Acidoferrales bacterium]|nr:GNAT family N-acetyltransferase [Candidatus Acidoferrales bacterium]
MSAFAASARFAPARTLDDEARAALFNRGYEGYEVPLHLDAAALREHVRLHDVDLDVSRVASTVDGPVGFVYVAKRDARAWIGGMGVVPEARRAGLGRALMQAAIEGARDAGADEIVLEVLRPNERARRLYESLGFRTVRELEVWTLVAEPPAGCATALPVDEARAWIAAHRTAPEAWQLGDASVDRIASPERPLIGLQVREGPRRIAAVVGVASPQRASLLQAAFVDGDASGAARALVAELRRRAPALRALNVAAGSPVSAAMRHAGATLEAGQFEMTLALAEARGA